MSDSSLTEAPEATETSPTVSSIFDLSDGINVIEKSFVADNTTINYIRGLTTFMIWLFDTNRSYLEEGVVTQMILEDEFDRVAREAPKKKSYYKRKRPILEDENLDRKNLRNFCMGLLRQMKPSFNASAHLCPIKLQGDQGLNYQVIREYMMMKKRLFFWRRIALMTTKKHIICQRPLKKLIFLMEK